MQLKHVSVEFLGIPHSPGNVYSAHIYHNRYEHEVAVITFREWGSTYESVEPGTPVVVKYGFLNKKTMYGYVSHIKPNRTRNSNNVTIYVLGPSYVMKQQRQRVFKETTADAIVKEIGAFHGFAVHAVSHPRVWPQVAQSGASDWQLLVKLAKDCGYSLRVDGTELYFQPMLHEYALARDSAHKFVLTTSNSADGGNMYSFHPIVGDSVEYEDAFKAAVAISGVDGPNSSAMQIVEKANNKATRKKTKPEVFDRFNTHTVATDQSTAAYEAKAAEDRNSFPYRADVTVLGNTELRPDMPVFLDGLGTTYSGYWTILKVTHEFVEETRNNHMYKTHLVVGSNSLGGSTMWTDNRTVEAPHDVPRRVVNPTAARPRRNTEAVINTRQLSLPKQARTPFGLATNKPKNVGGRSNSGSSPVWSSRSPGVVKPDTKTSKPYHVVARLQKRGVM